MYEYEAMKKVVLPPVISEIVQKYWHKLISEYFKRLTLNTFKEEVLRLQLIEVVGVDDKYSIAEDVTKNCTDDQSSPAVSVRPGPRKKGKNARENCLNNAVVGLQ